MEISTPTEPTELIMLGDFVVPVNFPEFEGPFNNVETSQFPPVNDIPKEYFSMSNEWNKRASELFFEGGTIDVKPEFNRKKVYRAVSGYLQSFAPKHEHKLATVAWLLATHTNP